MTDIDTEDRRHARLIMAALLLPTLLDRANTVGMAHRCDIALAHADTLLARAAATEIAGAEAMAARLRELAPLVAGVAPDAQSVIELAAAMLEPPIPVPA